MNQHCDRATRRVPDGSLQRRGSRAALLLDAAVCRARPSGALAGLVLLRAGALEAARQARLALAGPALADAAVAVRALRQGTRDQGIELRLSGGAAGVVAAAEVPGRLEAAEHLRAVGAGGRAAV